MSVFVLPADPPVREDGRCAQCGKRRKRPKQFYADPGEFDRDPFCSTECCRGYHGVPIVAGRELTVVPS